MRGYWFPCTLSAKQMNGATLFMEVKPIAKNNNTKMFVPCSGNGECRLDGHCECKENWYGIDCSKNRICPEMIFYNSHIKCSPF